MVQSVCVDWRKALYGLLIIERIVILLLLYPNSFLVFSLKKRIMKIISNCLSCYNNIVNIVHWTVMTSYLICRPIIYAKLWVFEYYTLQIRFRFCDSTYLLLLFALKD